MSASTQDAKTPKLEAGAFKKLYPEQFYKQHIDGGYRPDGRTFGRARPTTIGLDATATADSSALVKIGNTTVLAGIKLEVIQPDLCAEAEVLASVGLRTIPPALFSLISLSCCQGAHKHLTKAF